MVSIKVTHTRSTEESSHSLFWYQDLGGSFKGSERSPLNAELQKCTGLKNMHMALTYTHTHTNTQQSGIMSLRLSHHVPVGLRVGSAKLLLALETDVICESPTSPM